jgi:hypothetical protein
MAPNQLVIVRYWASSQLEKSLERNIPSETHKSAHDSIYQCKMSSELNQQISDMETSDEFLISGGETVKSEMMSRYLNHFF